MDYAEEQQMELQALEAIYMDDFKRIEGAGLPSFDLKLQPETGGGDDVNHVAVTLRVTYTPTYPESSPGISVRRIKGLEDSLIQELEGLLRDAAGTEELLGTAMVYPLVERAQAWLAEHNIPERDMHAEMMARIALEEVQEGAGEDDIDGDENRETGCSRLRDIGKKRASTVPGDWRFDPTVVSSLSETSELLVRAGNGLCEVADDGALVCLMHFPFLLGLARSYRSALLNL